MQFNFTFILLALCLTTGAPLFSAANSSDNRSLMKQNNSVKRPVSSDDDVIEIKQVRATIKDLGAIAEQLRTMLLSDAESLASADVLKVALMQHRITVIQRILINFLPQQRGERHTLMRRSDALDELRNIHIFWNALVPLKTAPNNPVHVLLSRLYKIWKRTPALAPDQYTSTQQ